MTNTFLCRWVPGKKADSTLLHRSLPACWVTHPVCWLPPCLGSGLSKADDRKRLAMTVAEALGLLSATCPLGASLGHMHR